MPSARSVRTSKHVPILEVPLERTRTPNRMIKHAALFALLTAAGSTPLLAQFDASQVKYWVGTGADTSILVVDFQDGSTDPSYAWGWLHNGGTGADMLEAIAAADVNFSIDVAGGFLNSITYASHSGIGGTPDYWSTWNGTSIATMATNGGLSATLGNGDWFGCSYTDFNPALNPTEPLAAFEPFQFTASDVETWIGTGPDSTILVIDFQDGTGTSSFAWGYAFSGTVTGETMLADITAADAQLSSVVGGGFLSDVSYGTHSGLGGNPNYWSTWSGDNWGAWSMNAGLSTTLVPGGLFGCSYTDFDPALRPGYPVPADIPTGVQEVDAANTLLVYPQPANDLLRIRTSAADSAPIDIFNMTGERVHTGYTRGGGSDIQVGNWAAGMYLLRVGSTKRTIIVH